MFTFRKMAILLVRDVAIYTRAMIEERLMLDQMKEQRRAEQQERKRAPRAAKVWN